MSVREERGARREGKPGKRHEGECRREGRRQGEVTKRGLID